MKKAYLKHFALIFCLLAIGVAQNSTNITFASPPPINISTVASFSGFSGDDRLFRSTKLQNMVLTMLPPINNIPITNFKLRRFKRGSPNNIEVFEFNKPGVWGYVESTKQSFACTIVLDAMTSSVGFIQFENNTFEMIFQSTSLDISSFQTANMGLKEKCLVYNEPNLYKVTSTGLLPIPIPSTDWDISSAPERVSYIATGYGLYRYNPSSYTYTKIYTFTTNITNTNYDLRSYQTNIVLAVATNTTSNISQIFQEFYIFSDYGSLSLIQYFSINARNPSNLPILPVYTSPQLSKFGVTYFPLNNSTQSFILKSINFKSKSVLNLSFQEPSRFLDTIRNTPALFRDYYLNENYYVLRNTSGFNASFPQFPPVEQTYQFVNDKVVFLRYRNLSGYDLTNYSKTFIDPYYQNQLVVLNTYANDNGFTVDEAVYGNLVAINRIVPVATPPFISFVPPTNTANFIPRGSLAWVYLNTVANNTGLILMRANPNVTNNIEMINSNLGGDQSILAMNEKCIIFKQAGGSITVASFPSNLTSSPNSTVSFLTQDVTQLLFNSNATPTGSSAWMVSNACDRFAVDNKIFYRTINQSTFAPLVLSQAPSSIDQNITAAVIGNSLWLLNFQTNTFSLVVNNTNALPASQMYKVGSRIVITAANTTSAQVLAYSMNSSGAVKSCLNYLFNSYQGTPSIKISSNLSKVLIVGPFIPPNKTQVQPKYDAFFIDFAEGGFKNISFPFNNFPDPLNSYILIDQSYLYIRSLSTNLTNSTRPQQNTYYINQDIAPQIALSVNLTQDQVTSFQRAVFVVNSKGTLYNYVEFLNGSQVIVNQIQVTPDQAKIKENSNILGVTAMVSNGVIVLCAPGCADCSSGSCSSCSSAWTFDSSSYTCFKCGQNCASCSSQNIQLCYTCLTGAYLTSSSTCARCNSTCVSCDQTATNCLSCSPSKVFVNGTCVSCPRNCISCSDASSCLSCARGFVLTSSGTCRGCAVSCSNCSLSNITECTSCAPGLSLVNGSCLSCPDKCKTCNGQVCAACIPGYVPNTAGVCVLNCAVSCATCTDNQPTLCLSCYGSNSYLSNGKCYLNTTCNNDSSCTNCGQGLGYVLVGSLCVQCSSIDNCLQCSSTNTANCSLCANGYYIDKDQQCSSCSTGCLQCSSADICTACSVGYTLPQNVTQAQCLKCESPCSTCLGITTYCLTCESGYNKKGWKCQKGVYSSFTFTLSDTPTNVLANIDYIVGRLLLILGLNSSQVDVITFNSINSGSTVVSGSATTSDTSASSAALSSGLSGGSLGTYSVTSSSVSSVGTSEEKKEANVGLIVGVVIGLVAFIAICVIIGYVIYKKKTSNKKIESEIEIHEDGREKKPSSQFGQDIDLNPQNPSITKFDKEDFQ